MATVTMDVDETKHPVKPKLGRPTKYRPEMCEMVIELARTECYFLSSIADHLDISEDTLYRWMRENKDFSEACTRARQIARNRFMKLGLDNLLTSGGQKFNENTFRMLMQATGGIPTVRINPDSKKMSYEEEMEAIRAVAESGDMDVEHAERRIALLERMAKLDEMIKTKQELEELKEMLGK